MRLLITVAIVLAGALSALTAGEADLTEEMKRPTHIEFPEESPYSPQIAALGKMLFFDPRISGAQNMSCATCHNPSFGWETPVPLAIGAMNVALSRHAPTVENLADAPALFWDGRAATLEEQAIGPITHPEEMNATLDEVQQRLSQLDGYRRAFDIAFPGSGLNTDNILRAIATYERTLLSGRSPFDDWLDGDENALSKAAKRGFELFVGEARCASCHAGWSFTDHGFHDIGLRSADPGRTGDASDDQETPRQAFKTPGLRNIGLRAPYMHNGAFSDLSDVIRHYNSGGLNDLGRIPDIVPLELTEVQVTDLIEFLESLTAVNPHVSQPALPAR